jgi:hypothetical protein
MACHNDIMRRAIFKERVWRWRSLRRRASCASLSTVGLSKGSILRLADNQVKRVRSFIQG